MQVMKAGEHFAQSKAATGHPPAAWPHRLDLCQLLGTQTPTTHEDTSAYLHLDTDNPDPNPTCGVLLSNFPGWNSSPWCWLRPTGGNPAFSTSPKLLSAYPQLFSAFHWYPLLFQFGTLEGEEQISSRTLWKSYYFFPLQTNREHVLSIGLNADTLGGLDQKTSFARRPWDGRKVTFSKVPFMPSLCWKDPRNT